MDLVENAVNELAPYGEVIFYELDIHEKPIAIAMGFQYGEKYMQYLTGFDTESSKFSPGTVLLSMIIERCYDKGLKEVDMLRGQEGYKYHFGATDRTQIHFRSANRGLIRSAEYTLRESPLS